MKVHRVVYHNYMHPQDKIFKVYQETEMYFTFFNGYNAPEKKKPS